MQEGNLQLRHAYGLGLTNAGTVVTRPGNVSVGGGLTEFIYENFALNGDGSGPTLFSQDGGTIARLAGTIGIANEGGIGGASAMEVYGPITGPGYLNKSGGGNTTLLNTNAYTGGTLVSGGTLTLGTNGPRGWLPPIGGVTNNANLVFNSSATNTLTNVLSGTGQWTQEGTGTMILSASNDLSGLVRVVRGNLRVTNPEALGTRPASPFTGPIAASTDYFWIMDGYAARFYPYLPAGALELAGSITLEEPIRFGARNINTNGTPYYFEPGIRSVSGSNTLASYVEIQGGAADHAWEVNAGSALYITGILTNESSYTRAQWLYGDGYGEFSGNIVARDNGVSISPRVMGNGTWRFTGPNINHTGENWAYNGTLVLDATIAGPVF